MHETVPFSIPPIRDFVPEKLKPWILVAFVIIFQLSGGVYLAAVSEMVGSLSLMQEDIMMAGYASLVGLSLVFTIMFRLRFRFPLKASLLSCCTAIIIGNFICMYTQSVPVLVATCFITGGFRMWGTFACNTNIQLWITPKRDLSIFFCFICILVQGSIQLSGIATIYTAFFAAWEYMHLLVIGLLCIVMLVTLILFTNCRTMPKLPLYGIDWLGALLWGGTVLSIIFVCIYGEHYDWFQSIYIRAASIAAVVMLLLNVWRASFIRHPFIANETWRFKPVYLTCLAYLVIDLLIAPAHLLEHIYMESTLGYDVLHAISLNWAVFAGIAIGAFFTYKTFATRKWTYKTMNLIALSAIVIYLLISYFSIDYNVSKNSLVLPLFLRGFGYAIISICFLTILTKIPFQNFFQSLSVQAFFSAGIGGVLGTAILGRALKFAMKRNSMLLGAQLDHVNPLAQQLSTGELYGVLQQQALMVSMKELYGWLTLLGIFCLLLLIVKGSDIRPKHTLYPTYRAIRRRIKRELQQKRTI